MRRREGLGPNYLVTCPFISARYNAREGKEMSKTRKGRWEQLSILGHFEITREQNWLAWLVNQRFLLEYLIEGGIESALEAGEKRKATANSPNESQLAILLLGREDQRGGKNTAD